MEVFETFLPSSTRISCSLPSSPDFPKAPLGRPSSFPALVQSITFRSPSASSFAVCRFMTVQFNCTSR